MNNRLLKIIPLLILALVFGASSLCLAAEKSYIIGFKHPPGKAEKAMVRGAGGSIQRAFQLIPALAVKVPEQALRGILRNPHVAYVEEDVHIQAVEPVPGSMEYENVWGVTRIGSDAVHLAGTTGDWVSVAVIDTGIDYTHPDLDDNYYGGYDFVFNDADPFDDSYNSHGTHVAGIVAAVLNGSGVVGVAPETALYAVKVLDGTGNGLLSWIIAGIEWTVMNGIGVANMSLGIPVEYPSQSLQDACDAAYAAGLILVAAAGNYTPDIHGPVMYPAAYDSVIAVSATTPDDALWFRSASGPEVELAAPGAGIFSTVSPASSVFLCQEHPCYGSLSGTSQASPHVAGVAALLLSSDFSEDLNGDGVSDHQDVRLQMQGTAQDLGRPKRDDAYGYGLVRADEAVPVTPPPPAPHLVVTKEKGPAADSAQSVFVSGKMTKIKIVNDSLSRMDIDVYEDGSLRKDLSKSYRFDDGQPHNVLLKFEDPDTTFEIVFVPRGTEGTFADVYIREH